MKLDSAQQGLIAITKLIAPALRLQYVYVGHVGTIFNCGLPGHPVRILLNAC